MIFSLKMNEIAAATTNKRTGVYIIKTHIWYLERMVWLVAAFVLLLGSILSFLHSSNWAFIILCVGLSSVFVSLTGFCIVGNVLYRLGAEPLLLESLKPKRRGTFYFMQTDKWYLERYIYLIVGINLSWTSVLVKFHSIYWLLFPVFVGAATIVFAFTGFCILANLLYRLGAEPRLCRNL
jgi:hypothetical protein